jgi:hypothetical protein
VKQHRVTRLGAGNLAHQKLRGHAFEHHGGALLVAEAIGKLDEDLGRNDALLRIGAGAAACIGDTVSDGQISNPLT